MTIGLYRYYGANDLHFITCSCYQRQPQLGSGKRRDLFLRLLEEARCQYRFVVHGYVVMPEHFHLLVTEPEVGDPSVVMKVIKERFTRQLNRERREQRTPSDVFMQVGQKRFYDFNLWSAWKRIEKLRYMHRNPVKRGLVDHPDQWNWSSFRAYAYGERGLVRVNFQEWELEVKRSPVERFGERSGESRPLIRKERE